MSRFVAATLRAGLLIAALTAWSGTAGAQVYPTQPPPPMHEEIVPPPPHPGPPGRVMVWRPGYWRWAHGGYVWVPGHYARAPHPRAVWVPEHWEQHHRHWVLVPGHWG